MTEACWKCGNRVPDGGGFCRRCGVDLQFPAHAPTIAELRDAARGKVSAPSFRATIRYFEKRGEREPKQQ